MPSPIAHTLAAYTALVLARPDIIRDRQTNSLAIGSAFVFGTLADADFAVAAFTHSRVWGHHFFSHSIPFLLIVTAVSYAVLKLLRRPRAFHLACLAGLLYGTHLLLDTFTEDGSAPYGIPLLWPFTRRHFYPPVTIFFSIHRGDMQAISGPNNLHAILIEAVVMAPIAFLAVVRAMRVNRAAAKQPLARL